MICVGDNPRVGVGVPLPIRPGRRGRGRFGDSVREDLEPVSREETGRCRGCNMRSKLTETLVL